jgi:RNA polymerase sigma-70 factor (ECF subfamily)
MNIGELYKLHNQELISHLMRMVKCRETAQDIAQDCYLILANSASTVTIDHPRGFLYRTASNLAIDHFRHNKIVERFADLEQIEGESKHPSVEVEISKEQWRALLHQTIHELPPRCRDVFLLHKVRGLSYREVARFLDISESAVEKHIIKGLMHCRNRLGKYQDYLHQFD